ncbi:MAG TPA: BMP family ABC transporter substrate-binding protein [Bradyrhizobium sp.]|jgi:basic membrane protein A|nr:BMP family ABC transporter substrate-binding protein [Bradyrhizobium sp.]
MRKTILAAAAALLLAGVSGDASAADKLKVGFIYLGPVGDLGWTYQHELARQALVKEFGDKVETTFLENVPEGPDAERAIEQLVRAGNKLIFTTSFGYMDPTLKVAKKYPNVHFEHCSGYKRDKNMSTYSARWYQGRYIQGQIAAKMSKAGVLGYIGSFPIPEVVSGINATMLGALSVNPNMKVKIIWVNSWFDPGKEADAAKALLDQGADIITQHTDSPAPMQIVSERGKFAFGQDSEMIKFGPKAQLTSILDTWAPYYIARVKAEMDGTWKESDVWGGLDTKMFEMAPYTNMPDDVKKMAEDTQAALTSGKLQPFKCPVVGQDGKDVECKGGDHLADEQVLSMNYYIKGIDDKLPGK